MQIVTGTVGGIEAEEAEQVMEDDIRAPRADTGAHHEVVEVAEETLMDMVGTEVAIAATRGGDHIVDHAAREGQEVQATTAGGAEVQVELHQGGEAGMTVPREAPDAVGAIEAGAGGEVPAIAPTTARGGVGRAA